MNLSILELNLHWVAEGFYIVASLLFAHAVLFQHEKRVKWGVLATVIGLLPHSAALLIRWIQSGHGPYMLKYEVLSSNAWITLIALLILLWLKPNWAALSLLVVPACFLMIGFGLMSSPEIRELPPTLRSIWLVFHVLFNKFAVGAFILSAAAAGAVLLKQKAHPPNWLNRLPGTDVLDAYLIRFVGFGFIFWSTTIIAGSIWAQQSWGRYWGWDPIETWSLVTWLCYGSLLHSRRFFRMGIRATAWVTLLCFGISILTIFILPFLIPSLHAAYFQ